VVRASSLHTCRMTTGHSTAVRGTFCDLAVKLESKLVELIEVKSAGSILEDRHVKQAIDYASNQGVEWVILTNATIWRLYKVIFAKPIDKRLLPELDLSTVDLKKDDCLEQLFLFTKEGCQKAHT
jgi:predicted type IV restriction endonuclease